MNLHGLAIGLISAVNPQITASYRASTGYAIGDDGAQVPSYADAVDVPAQVQPLTFRDITQMDGLNLQGTRRGIYLFGRADGIVRSTVKGGDLITIADGVNAGIWLVAIVAEQFPDWCKILCTLQNEEP